MGTAIEHAHAVKLLSAFTLGFTVTLGLVVLTIMLVLWYQERKRVYKMPRKPMTMCDKHGAYNSESSLKIRIPEEGKPDLIQEICPMCFEERSQMFKQKLAQEDKQRLEYQKTNGGT